MDNYQYWQLEGAYWKEEYENRRRNRFYFIIQEAVIAYFFSLNRPAKVLEYGCGVGRHLKYLREMSNLKIYGCDQSPTMLDSVREWGGGEWFEKHIELIEPTGTLPYEDGTFDIAFTSEVLIHTRPEHVMDRLREILRVSKKGVFHIEPDLDTKLCHDAHYGCWNHNYLKLYHEIGIECLMLPKFFENQGFFLVDMAGCLETGLLKNKVFAEKFNLLECLFEGFTTRINLFQGDLDSKAGALEELYAKINCLQTDLDSKIKDLDCLQTDLDSKIKDLEKRHKAFVDKDVEKDHWISQINQRAEAMRIDRQIKRMLQRFFLFHRKKG